MLEIVHFTEASESELLFGGGFTGGILSNMVNCGVYLFSVAEMYREPLYKDYADKYARILAITKDDGQEKSLS